MYVMTVMTFDESLLLKEFLIVRLFVSRSIQLIQLQFPIEMLECRHISGQTVLIFNGIVFAGLSFSCFCSWGFSLSTANLSISILSFSRFKAILTLSNVISKFWSFFVGFLFNSEVFRLSVKLGLFLDKLLWSLGIRYNFAVNFISFTVQTHHL